METIEMAGELYRDYVKKTQRRRREALDKEAQGVGFKSWSELETAVKNHEYILPDRNENIEQMRRDISNLLEDRQ